ncbi:hypothetical protein [Pedobacter gandavensis]|uniref:hypothetical protein n=1 Tax=Pedobacter gandavensis TaxID=2679963 RepID=UPI0029305EB3|nr:hypothetical protein [Pedobacter gandavensis]
MKIQFPVIGLLSGMLLFSCTSSEKKENNTDTLSAVQNSTATPTDTTVATVPAVDQKTVDLIKLKLNEIYKDDLAKNLIDTPSRKFKLFEVNLNEDPKKEILVGLTGSYFCGSGGCTMLLFDAEGKVLNKFTVVDYPVSVATTSTKGWKDLIIQSNGKDHLIKYNGKAYPANPSIQAVADATAKKDALSGLALSDPSFNW